MKPKTTASARRFRARMRAVRRLYARAGALLTKACTELPEYVPLGGPATLRAIKALKARDQLLDAAAAVTEAEKVADIEAPTRGRLAAPVATPKRSNPSDHTEEMIRLAKTVVRRSVVGGRYVVLTKRRDYPAEINSLGQRSPATSVYWTTVLDKQRDGKPIELVVDTDRESDAIRVHHAFEKKYKPRGEGIVKKGKAKRGR